LYQYIFGAINPSDGTSAALILPQVDTGCLQLHLEEISSKIPSGRHAVVIMDQAGWHISKSLKVPSNISLLHLPPYSPQLNPQENIWRYLKDTFLSNRTFDNSEDIMDACCEAWNSIAGSPELIMSIGNRDWASII
jgi:hypothetical protein